MVRAVYSFFVVALALCSCTSANRVEQENARPLVVDQAAKCTAVLLSLKNEYTPMSSVEANDALLSLAARWRAFGIQTYASELGVDPSNSAVLDQFQMIAGVHFDNLAEDRARRWNLRPGVDDLRSGPIAEGTSMCTPVVLNELGG